MAGLGCVAVKWPGVGGVEGGARLKNFGALDGKIAVLSHIKGLYKTALLKANIGRVSVVQSSVLCAYIQYRAGMVMAESIHTLLRLYTSSRYIVFDF
jgi:hypothetical protein